MPIAIRLRTSLPHPSIVRVRRCHCMHCSRLSPRRYARSPCHSILIVLAMRMIVVVVPRAASTHRIDRLRSSDRVIRRVRRRRRPPPSAVPHARSTCTPDRVMSTWREYRCMRTTQTRRQSRTDKCKESDERGNMARASVKKAKGGDGRDATSA